MVMLPEQRRTEGRPSASGDLIARQGLALVQGNSDQLAVRWVGHVEPGTRDRDPERRGRGCLDLTQGLPSASNTRTRCSDGSLTTTLPCGVIARRGPSIVSPTAIDHPRVAFRGDSAPPLCPGRGSATKSRPLSSTTTSVGWSSSAPELFGAERLEQCSAGRGHDDAVAARCRLCTSAHLVPGRCPGVGTSPRTPRTSPRSHRCP